MSRPQNGVPMGQPDSRVVDVIYVAGHGRSGSTLLERLLGQLDGVVAVGELRQIWQRSFRANQPCGCGSSFADCSFWQEVARQALGEQPRERADELAVLQQRIDRARNVPRLLVCRGDSRFGRDRTRYAETLASLYAGIVQAARATHVLDSSKDPSTLYVLARTANVRLHVVHLVRDPRAVAFSWQRKKVWLVAGDERLMFPQVPAARSALDWVWRNLLAGWSRRFAASYLRLRYEDVVAQPVPTITAILEAVGAGRSDLGFIDGGAARLDRVNHTLSGNPVRFASGSIPLRLDSEWAASMPHADRRKVTLLTMPLLLHYGYPISARVT